MGYVNQKLSQLFYFLGENVISKYPTYCILVPIITSLLLASGLVNVNFVNDLEYLYTPKNGPSKTDRAVVETLFTMNYSEGFDISRPTRLGRFLRVIVTEQNDQSLLKSEIWKDILELDKEIHNVSVVHDNVPLKYENLCARWEKLCYENDILDLGNNSLMDRIENGTLRLSYPIMFNYENFKTYPLPKFFGGVKLKMDNTSVLSANALLLQYILAVDNDDDDEIGKEWEMKVVSKLIETQQKWKRIQINYLTKESFPQEINASIGSIIPYFVITSFLMVMFTIGSSMNCKNTTVLSKPWLGVTGFISALLGTLAGYGLMSFCGVPFAEICLSVPFIMIGIGIDDTFVMLASWRQTQSGDKIPKRIAECYSEAATSITITSLTDMLSFFVGIFTNIPSIQIFSAYAGTCVLFIYLWQVFLLGGAMAISGFHEQSNRHSILWWLEVPPRSRTESMSSLQRIFFMGGTEKPSVKQSETSLAIDLQTATENSMMAFFRDNFAPFICNFWVKLAIIGISISYICVSCWGISSIQEGLQQERLVPYSSYVSKFIHKEKEYLKEFTYRIQVVVSSPLVYSNNETQNRIADMLEEFYQIDHISKEYSENWLRDYLHYLKLYGELEDFNITSEAEFIYILQTNFLKDYLPISKDVVFNEDHTEILASRYIIQSKHVMNTSVEKELVVNLREVAEKIGRELKLNVTIYHSFFDFADQFIVIRELTIKLMSLSMICVMTVTVIFIPNLVCCICVFATIASIEIGVLGFMSLWNVSLDLFSINCIVMCIGFSVDFSAHISFAYITSGSKNLIDTSEARVKSAMHSLGMPILQGGISTLIGISLLVLAQSYTFMTFFKVIFLVIVFAMWHALFLLPVLLILIKPENLLRCRTKNSYNLRDSITGKNWPQTIEKYEPKPSIK